MNPYETKGPNFSFLYHQDVWFSGIDRSMKTLGSANMLTSDDMIRLQNAAIRDCWAVTGNHVRRAMFKLSDNTGIYPEELKDDSVCRKMLANIKVRT